MKQKREIILHCTGTEYNQIVTLADARRWHKARGWRDIGYHYLIQQNGLIVCGRDVNLQGAHCKGHNEGTIGVAYVGGLINGQPADTRTSEQKKSIVMLIRHLKSMFEITGISGHREYCNVACPCFDVKQEYGKML